MGSVNNGLWHRRKVVVTGAGGFIGSHLVTRRVSEGASVKALVHYNSRGSYGNLEFLPEPVVDAGGNRARGHP